MKFSQLLVFATIALISASSFAFNMGPLNQYLEPGSFGAWELAEQDGAAIFNNQQADGDINYYFVGANPGEAGQREISVEVGILRNSNFSKAGLLYGFENDPRSYFMFTIDNLATVRLEYRSPTGWEERISNTIAGLDSKNVTLSIREDGQQISLLVNGVEQSAIGNDRMGRGNVGIVTVGIGTYGFRGFDIKVDGTGDDGLNPGQDEAQTDAEGIKLQSGSSDNSTSTKDPSSSKPGQLPDGVLHVRAVDLIDKHGFNQPIRAASTLIPADWKFDGSVHWVADGCFKGTYIVFDAISPDERSNISMLPATTVQWSQIGPTNNCAFLRADRAEAMIRPVLDQVMQNIKIVKTERNPQLTAQNKQSTFQGVGHQSWADHIIATVEHDRHGTRHRALVRLDTHHLRMSLPMYEGPVESMIGVAKPTIFSAPVEQFDNFELEIQLIVGSFKIDQAWQAKMNKHNQAITDDNLKTGQKIAEINRNTNAEIAAINAGTVASTSASNDRNHRRILDMLTDRQTVQGKDGLVNVPVGTVWQTDDGSMYVSQNSAFDPNNLGVTATKLEPVR